MFSPEGRADFCSGNAETGYRLVYNIEAYLRHMLRWEIVAKGGRQWRTLLGEAGNRAAALQRNETDLRIIDADEHNVLSYILLSELKDVMMSNAVWPIFKSRWPPQDIFASTFKIFNALRAKVAHFRRLTARDMRRIDEFKTLIVEMTEHYRAQRRAAARIEVEQVHEAFRAYIEAWLGDIATQQDAWQEVALGTVHNYLVVEARLASGAIAPDAISTLVKAAATDAFFLSIDHPRVKIRAYLPRSLKADEAAKVIAGLRGIRAITGDVIPDEPIDENFDLEIPFDVLLPMDFRV